MTAAAKITLNQPLRQAPLLQQEVNGLPLAYRQVGPTPDKHPHTILFLHGWPLNGLTYEGVIDQLSDHYHCIAVDLPGLGTTPWHSSIDLTPEGQAHLLNQFMVSLGITSYAVYGNDSGGMIARHLAVIAPSNVSELILSNTEVPFERPPWLPMYRHSLSLPGAGKLLKAMISIDRVAALPMVLGGVFYDTTLLKGQFKQDYLRPLLESPERFRTALQSFYNITDWKRLDAIHSIHPTIQQPTLFIWGENDKTFPLAAGQTMAKNFPNTVQFCVIEKSKLFVHQENPLAVSGHIVQFLQRAS